MIKTGLYKIINRISKKVLDVEKSSKIHKANVQQWSIGPSTELNSPSRGQLWFLENIDDIYVKIINLNSNLVLTCDGINKFANISRTKSSVKK